MASQQKICGNRTDHFLNKHHQSTSQVLNFDRLNYEEERIKTFASWAVHYPVDPLRLAKAGFYYSGTEDEVICFSCKGHIKNWNYGDIVLKKHSDLYPNCDFIKNKSNNVPLVKTSVKSSAQPTVTKDINTKNINYLNIQIDYNKMKSESERFKTFVGKWPLSFVNTADLAHAGFFYTGIDDKVQCPFCKGVKGNWEVGSNPFQEHLKHFPFCDFLYENISGKKGPLWFQSSGQDVCGNMKKVGSSEVPPESVPFDSSQQSSTNLTDLGVHLYKNPVHPQQASLMARLRSFATWPPNAPVSKEDLAAAGFFYIGKDDRTICFYCNGGLCSWEAGDDPWVEHARWFSNCDFLLLNKGVEFIKSCYGNGPPKVLKGNFSQQPQLSGNAEPLLRKVDEAMKSKLVKCVLDSEIFPPYIVRAAILLHIKKTGSSFTDMDDLCVAASYLKEEMEDPSFHVKPVSAEDLNIHPSTPETDTNVVVSSINNISLDTSSGMDFSEEKMPKNAEHAEKSDSLDDEAKDACLCKICMDREVGIVFLPCGHLPACIGCAPALKYCPMCRKPIQATVRCYLS